MDGKSLKLIGAFPARTDGLVQVQGGLQAPPMNLRLLRMGNLPLQARQSRFLLVQVGVGALHRSKYPGLFGEVPCLRAAETRTDRPFRTIQVEAAPKRAPKRGGQVPVACVFGEKPLDGERVEAKPVGARQGRRSSRLTVAHPGDLPAATTHRPANIAAQEFPLQVQARRVVSRVNVGEQVLQRPDQTALAYGVGSRNDVDLVAPGLERESRLDSGQGLNPEAAQLHQSCSGDCASSVSRAR